MRAARTVGPPHAALRGAYAEQGVCVVSHSWEKPWEPDVDGVQLAAVRTFLIQHPEIVWVW